MMHRLPSLLAAAAHNTMDPHWLIIAFGLLTQFCVFLRWLHRRMRDTEISRVFTRDMATNHLPHIYDALRRIAQHHRIDLPEPPPVRFVELNSAERRKQG